MRPATGPSDRFVGEIAGTGTASGVRLVIGHWPTSPFGTFADVMVEEADGHRVLIAPREPIASYVSAVYTFDEVVVAPVEVVRQQTSMTVRAAPLSAELTIGRRDALGHLLRAVPRPLSASPRWAAAIDPICRVILRNVRTRTRTAGGEEFYAATDRRRLCAVSATWRGADLGPITDVSPPVRFGGSSAPRRPSIVAITTTVRPAARPRAVPVVVS